MIPVKRNHFYTKELITNAIGIYPQFKDMTSSTETTFEFKGGLGATRYVLSGQTSETPFPGQGDLRGAYLQTYVTGMSISGGAMLPVMTGYKLQRGFPITEGGFSMGTGSTTVGGGSTGMVGDKVWVSTQTMDGDEPWLEENFDGADKTLGSALMQQSASATINLADAYVTPKEGAESITYGGDGFFGGGGSNNVEHNLGKFFSAGGSGGERERVYVRPVKKNRLEGLWTALDDHRNEKQKWQIYAPYWKWKDVKGILKFDKKEATTNNTDALPTVTENNTVFNDLYRTPTQGNPWSWSGDEVPLMDSKMELSASKGGNGQALRMYHVYNMPYAPHLNQSGWRSQCTYPMGFEPQTNYASLYNIPYPIPNNVGGLGATALASGAMGVGDQRLVYPEINLSMNIAKLMPAPAIDWDAADSIVGTNAVCYGNQSGSADAQGTTMRNIGTESDDLDQFNKTFWRSVVVTFSNYTPEEAGATSLDAFLEYGMDSAYGLVTGTEATGSGKAVFANNQIGPKIVGGIVFESFYAVSGGAATLDGSGSQIREGKVYAYSLPVGPVYASGSATDSSVWDEQYGMIKATGATGWFTPGKFFTHRPYMGVLSGSSPSTNPATGRAGRPYVAIPKDEVFNMRIVIDVQQPWWKGTGYGWYFDDTEAKNVQYSFPTASENTQDQVGGVPMRVYFDSIKPPRQGNANAEVDYLAEYDEEKVPYINVEFPTYDKAEFHQYMSDFDVWGHRISTDTAADRRGGTFLYPKHMTIWVTNCGMAPASGSTPAYWDEKAKWFDNTHWVADDYAFPIEDSKWTGPSSIEAEVFIDSIKFKHWGAGTVAQHSAMQGDLKRFISSDRSTVSTPVKTVDKDGDTFHSKVMSVDGHMQELPVGQILTVGVKNKDWLMRNVEAAPAGGTVGGSVGAKTSYLLFNNFSTTKFGEIDRITPERAWYSVYEDGVGSDGASDMLSAGWEMWGQTASGSDADVQATQTALGQVFVQAGSSITPSTGTPFTSSATFNNNPYLSFGWSNTDSQDWLSTDGLTQKGFVKMTMSSGNANTFAVARENPLTSAKILEVELDGPDVTVGVESLSKNYIKVDNVDMFMEDADDEYIIYRAGELLTAINITGGSSSPASTALGYHRVVKTTEIDKNTDVVGLAVTTQAGAEVDAGIKFADDGSEELCVDKHLYQLYISPKRVWVNMMFSASNWQNPRKYESINIIEEKPATGSLTTQLGTTFNEAKYTYNTGSMTTKGLSAMPEYPWILDAGDEMSSVISDVDYGFGSYDDETNKGGEIGKEAPIINRHMTFDMSGIVDGDKLGPKDEVSIVLGLSSDTTNKGFTIVADDTTLDTSGSTFYAPQYIWEYYDELPRVDDFTVSSAYDVLSPDVNLYDLIKQPINNMKFTWKEQGEDIWYRHLIVSPSGAIENKYHNCSFWAPLNEPNIDYGATVQVPASYYTTHTSGMAKKTLNPSVGSLSLQKYHPSIDGIQGYALWKNSNVKSLLFSDSGTANLTTTGSLTNGHELKYSMFYDMNEAVEGTQSNNPWQNAWTLVVHCNPNNQDAAADTKTQGMTVCGVALYQSAANSGSSGGTPTCRIFAPSGTSDGNYASGSLTWDNWSYGSAANPNGRGGFDLLHVYMKDNKVFCHYNHEWYQDPIDTNTWKAFKGLDYEVLLLSSSTSYPLDGTEPMTITLVWQGKNNPDGADITGTTSTRSDDQFKMYIDGQLEDSTSCTRPLYLNGSMAGPNATAINCKGTGGFGPINYGQFVIGAFDTADGAGSGKAPVIGNITAEIGSTATTFSPTKYDNRKHGFHGTIEEIILYPYEVYMVPNANEYVLETNTLPDYTSTGSSGIEKSYSARLFLYDYTNIRGKGSDEVASSTPVQWRITGV